MHLSRWKFWVASALIALTFLSTSIIFWIDGDILRAVTSSLIWLVGQAVLYKRYYIGITPRYPLGVADQDDPYFPRFNIPRPLYLDERKRREQEERRNQIENESTDDT